MKKYKGVIIILLTFLITYITWVFETPTQQTTIYREYSQLIASIALVALAWINYISSRHGLLDNIFEGLDKSYIYHKYLSILAIVFIWVHNFTLKMGGPGGERGFKDRSLPQDFIPREGFKGDMNSGFFGFFGSGKQLGTLSMYIFTTMVLFFIIAYKLEYQSWKLIHKLLLVPYAFGLIHYYLDADYKVFAVSAYSIWMNIINAIGVIAALYKIFLYEAVAFKYRYKVSSIRMIAKDTLEITGTAINKEMRYKPGQFAFLKVKGKKNNFPSHPFTMSQAFKSGEIQFTIKALGDHTDKLKNTVAVGDTFSVSGPFGKFNYRTGIKRQIWLAGGIGITPFRAFWQYSIPPDYFIDFFYAYNNEDDAPYIDELKVLKPNDNLKIHLFDSSTTGFLSIKDFEQRLNKDEQYDVYFCGPVPMRDAVSRDLKNGNFKIKDMHFEYFKFK